MRLKKHSRFYLGQLGLTLVEILLISAVLVAFAVGSTYLLVQSKVSMTSMSQTGQCPILAKDILDRFIGFGTRLYGYSYDASLAHSAGNPKFRPLLIMLKDGTSYGGDSNIQDVGGHFRSISSKSQLAFPEILEKTINKLYLKMTNMQTREDGSWVNTGVPIIAVKKDSSKEWIELGSSVFLINTVNVLQYLYNSDDGPELFEGNDGKGKKWVLADMKDDGSMAEYEKRFLLKNLKVYLKITPFDTKASQPLEEYSDIECGKFVSDGTENAQYVNYPCPTRGTHKLILTRPRFSKTIKAQIPENYVIYGNPNIGFDLQVTVHYDKAGQTTTSQNTGPQFMCDASQVFTHQMDTVEHGHNAPNMPEEPESLTNGSNRDLISDGGPNVTTHQTTEDNYVSCGSEGSNYQNISLELDFNVNADERGTVIVCQGVSACRSDGTEDYTGQGITCEYQEGPWERCHNMTFPDQTTTTKAQLTSNSKLKLTFEQLPTNRRYDINVATLSTAGTLSEKKRIARFYLDSNQPYTDPSPQPGQPILVNKFLDKNVGIPTDGEEGREYEAGNKDIVEWKIPPDVFSTDQWLQCNTNDVRWEFEVEDQFLHNLIPCSISAARKDGKGDYSISSNIQDIERGENYEKCNGKLTGIKHGRHTLTLTATDSCDNGWEKNVVWDTDLPDTFEAKDLESEYWFYKRESPKYKVDIKLPATAKAVTGAAAGAGIFPKHYTVDCFGKYWCHGPPPDWLPMGDPRLDGDGEDVTCELKISEDDIDDGCNPNGIGVQYWHVCGRKSHKKSTWAVYTPLITNCKPGSTCSCENVECGKSLRGICCDGTGPNAGYPPCGNDPGAAKDRCIEDKFTPSCNNAIAGGNSRQDSQSQCPPLGLYTCTYTSDCVGSNTVSNSSECLGTRGGVGCCAAYGGCTDSNGNTYRCCVDAGTCSRPTGGCTLKDRGGETGQDVCLLNKICKNDDGSREPSDLVLPPSPTTSTPTVTVTPSNSCTCGGSKYTCGNDCDVVVNPQSPTRIAYIWSCQKPNYRSDSCNAPRECKCSASNNYQCVQDGTGCAATNIDTSTISWTCEAVGLAPVSCEPCDTTGGHFGVKGDECLPSCGHYGTLNQVDVSGTYCKASNGFEAGTQVESYQTCCTKGEELLDCACNTAGGGACDDGGGNHPEGDKEYETCCSEGYFHPSPTDDTGKYSGKYAWTCKPTVGSSTVCQNQLTCEAEKPTCTGPGEYIDEDACELNLPSDKVCIEDSGCWKREDQSSQCTCGTTRNRCGDGCIVRPRIGPKPHSYWYSFNYDGNRYARITKRYPRWDCYSPDNSKKEIKDCKGTIAQCSGGYKGNSKDPHSGFDGCNSCRTNGHITNRYMKQYWTQNGSSCTAYDNERCNYVGYCDKKNGFSCLDKCGDDNNDPSDGPCWVAECYATPRSCNPPCDASRCQTCYDGRCVGVCTR